MNLVIDNGNTNTKVALVDNNQILWQESFLLLTPKDIENIYKKEKVAGCITSSVGNISDACLDLLKDKGLILSASTKTPIENNYQSKNTLGNDRLAAVVAANLLYPDRNNLVIDIGTAITYDIVNDKAEYLGGNISPGFELRFKALNNYTEHLPLLKFEETDQPYGVDTKSAILVGVVEGVKKEIEGFINEYSLKFRNLNIIFTGGYAMLFDNPSKNHIFAEPNLVLIGLNRILEYNAQIH